MDEQKLNTIISKSIKRESDNFCHKIADGAGGHSIENPFDGFGVIHNTPLYFESKIIKKGLFSFNFNIIEKHQYKYLTEISDSLKIGGIKNYCVVPVGFYKARDFFYVLFFDINYIASLKEQGINSIKKKDLEKLVENKKYLEIKYEKIEEDGKTKKRVQFIQDIHKFKEVLIS